MLKLLGEIMLVTMKMCFPLLFLAFLGVEWAKEICAVAVLISLPGAFVFLFKEDLFF